VVFTLLFSALTADNFTHIPKSGYASFGLKLFFGGIIFQVDSMRPALRTFDLHVPAAFVHQSACATANGAALQFIQLVIHNFSYLKMVLLVS
jgi:hypothetical protein